MLLGAKTTLHNLGSDPVHICQRLIKYIRSGVSPDLQEGLVAYCAKQGSILHKMATSFSAEWYPLLSGYGIDSDWPEWTIPSGLSKSTSILPLASFQDDSGEADIEDNFLEDDIFGE
jgi:hypothetical protein